MVPAFRDIAEETVTFWRRLSKIQISQTPVAITFVPKASRTILEPPLRRFRLLANEQPLLDKEPPSYWIIAETDGDPLLRNVSKEEFLDHPEELRYEGTHEQAARLFAVYHHHRKSLGKSKEAVVLNQKKSP